MRTTLTAAAFFLAIFAAPLNGTANVRTQCPAADGHYTTNGNSVSYNGRTVPQADAKTFKDLGYGYGRDIKSVFYHGELLPYVDPHTFSLTVNRRRTECDERPERPQIDHHGLGHEHGVRHGGYFHDDYNAYYDGVKIAGASGGSSFCDLGEGYAKDAYNVYYQGKRIEGASVSSFNLIGHGYAKDSYNVYYYGKRIDGASAGSFEYTHDGYARDTYNTYYEGRKIN